MQGYRNLVVWQKGCALVVAVYRTTRAFPKEELYGLTSQLRRAAVSVPVNVAEGHCRRTRTDYLRFLSIAEGSIGELDTLLVLAQELGYLTQASARPLEASLRELRMMLSGLTQSLEVQPDGKRQTRRAAPAR